METQLTQGPGYGFVKLEGSTKQSDSEPTEFRLAPAHADYLRDAVD